VLEDVQHVGRRAPRRTSGGGLALRDDCLRTPSSRAKTPACAGPAPPKAKVRVAAIEPSHRHLADDVGHLQLDDAADACGALERVHADLGAERADGVHRGWRSSFMRPPAKLCGSR